MKEMYLFFSFLFCSIIGFVLVFLSFLLNLNCLTMLCWFLLYNKVNLLYVYIYTFLLGPPSPLSPPPPIQVTTEHQAELLAPYNNLLPAICFTHSSVHMSSPVSQFIPSPVPAHVHPSIFLCLCLYSCPVDRSICTIFLDSICMC